MQYTQTEQITINGVTLDVTPDRVDAIIAQILGQARAVEAPLAFSSAVIEVAEEAPKIEPSFEEKAQEVAAKKGTRASVAAVFAEKFEGCLTLKQAASKLKISSQSLGAYLSKIESEIPVKIRDGNKSFVTPFGLRVMQIKLGTETKPTAKSAQAELKGLL